MHALTLHRLKHINVRPMERTFAPQNNWLFKQNSDYNNSAQTNMVDRLGQRKQDGQHEQGFMKTSESPHSVRGNNTKNRLIASRMYCETNLQNDFKVYRTTTKESVLRRHGQRSLGIPSFMVLTSNNSITDTSLVMKLWCALLNTNS